MMFALDSNDIETSQNQGRPMYKLVLTLALQCKSASKSVFIHAASNNVLYLLNNSCTEMCILEI